MTYLSDEIKKKKTKRETVYKTFQCLNEYNKDILCDLILEETDALNPVLPTDNVDNK